MPNVVKSAKRQTILQVYAFCEKEKAEKKLLIPLEQVRARVAAMTGVSESTVTRIHRQERESSSASELPGPSKVSTPGKSRPKREKKIIIDDFDASAIRQKILSFYAVRKEIPTLGKLLAELRNDINFQGGRTTLWKILKGLGFFYKKCQSKRKILMERTDIAAWRYNYLSKIKQYREEGRTIVYLDETFIHSSYGVQKCWQSESVEGTLNKQGGTGRRWIIAYAGSENGFVDNSLLLFKSQTKSSDYHDDMNSENFLKWLATQVVPNLPPNCVVVMDNAPYHTVQINKAPTMASLKADMVSWLENKGLMFSPNVTKNVLYELIKKHKPEPIYKADQLIEVHGHTCLRLPPYHADLNPIELIWSVMKRRFAEKNVAQRDEDVERLVKESFSSIDKDIWKNECSHVVHIEEEYRKKDKVIDEESDRFLLWVGDSDSDDSASESDFDDEVDECVPLHLVDHNYV